MPRVSARSLASFTVAVLLLASSTFALDMPLSDEAIREAYFLGQRNDASTQRFLDKYRQHLPAPETGPWISAVELFTPYAEAVELSRQRTMGYSAQDATRDYRKLGDTLRVTVTVDFTPTYGYAIEQQAADRSSGTNGYILRSPDFWQDFSYRLFDGDTEIEPLDLHGHANYAPSDPGSSVMTGATIVMTFDATKIQNLSDVAVVVDTPDGQQVVAPYDLASLR
ncbi:MAG TPA: hypothetical protein VLV88_11400 [Terriglobales bacterium]|nr:hypothetical protein [Terriglobales bacterium]